MLSTLVIAAVALLAAGLTLYSGFGLGTLLLPAFALFFPVEIAVLATALVHGANNLFKLALVGRHADRGVVLRFGLPAVFASVLGALALGWFAGSESRLTIEADAVQLAEITPVKFVVGLLMIGFALLELLPGLNRLEFNRRYLPLGGLLSGFFGGLSGHQGALRSAFLVRAGLNTAAFAGSNAVIGFLVDLTRVAVYAGLVGGAAGVSSGFTAWPQVVAGCAAALCGLLLGRKYLHQVPMRNVRLLVGALLLCIGGALALGLI